MIKIHDKYKLLYSENTRYYIITGQRGSSKSFPVALYIAHKTYQKNQNIFFTRYTLESAKDSVIPEFEDKLDIMNNAHHFSKSGNDFINITSGSKLKFRGVKASQGSQTAKLKGLTNSTVWIIDEAEEFTDENLFDKLNKSLRGKNKDGTDKKFIIIFVMNPTYKKHWIYKRFFRDAGVDEHFTGVKDNVTYINMKWRDNKDNLDKDTIQENTKLEKENPKLAKKILNSGWLNPDEGLLFPELNMYDNKFTPNKNNTRIAYIDTADGGGDYYAMPIIEISNGYVYLLDVIYNKARITVNETLTVEKINTYGIDKVIVETNKEGSLYIGNLRKQTKSTIIGIHNTTKKETRILTQSGYILDKIKIRPANEQSTEYKDFINALLEYEIDSKEKQHDDAPDSLAGLFKYLRVYLKL
jgi:PBSX family phage terminase large subunit